ncbi:sugar ABC transporter permease [Gordonia sp. ABSL11-1]|uniref:carbohydrate ABC transporter permease n=1 Tax=Gordonia sp. ABSL11-1 TaxID=3053924 RepID=UPI0025724F90|nr:sugar ABC transporter permease [Gordonia sp. ABSL11-1]MDL9946011.1 sugar ABC transporter permease [Gordonia sp. ABSL11-1]
MTTGDNGENRPRAGRHSLPDDAPPREPSVRPPSIGDTGAQPVYSDAWTPPAGSSSAAAASGASAAAAPSGGSVATAERPQPAPAKGGKKISEGKAAERRLAFWLVAPAATMMALVTGYPIVYAFWLSLNKSSLSAPGERSFVWFENYVTVLSDSYWWTAFTVTLGITVVSVIIELVLGMAIALVMHRTIFGKGTIRTVVLIPYGIVTVAAAFSWYYAWTPETGYLANLLPDGSAPLTQQWPSLAIIVLAEVWKTTPFMALLLLAGLALVPDDLLKAAQVDGAGAWTRLWRIIIPLMKPAILVALLFRTLDAFRVFDNIYVLTRGSNNTYSVSMLGYDNLFKAFNLGVGSAISIVIFICVAIIAFIFIKGFGTAAPGSDNEGR